jgi:RNA polymerase sigma-70 factor (ECF subfamily)
MTAALALSIRQLWARTRPGAAADDYEGPLVVAAQRGDTAAAGELVRRHWDTSHRTAFLIVHDAAAAEDVCQEAMVAAVREIGRFDPRKPFGPWLHRIVVNRALDSLRARRRRGEVPLGHAAPERRAAEPAPAGRLPDDDLIRALATLDPADRTIVVLRHLLDYDSTEIGQMLELTPATVRTRLRRALDRVRAQLGDEQEER